MSWALTVTVLDGMPTAEAREEARPVVLLNAEEERLLMSVETWTMLTVAVSEVCEALVTVGTTEKAL